MTIYSLKGIYNGMSSDEYGVYFCLFTEDGRNSNEGKTEIITSKSLYKEKWDFHGSYDSEQLTFKIAIVKQDGTYINAYEQENIKEWLDIKEFAWLQFEQDDLYDKYFYCIINNPEPMDVGMQNAGFGYLVTCNSNHAWSQLYTKQYTSTSTPSTFNFYNTTKKNKYILSPSLEITPTSNGNISIVNNTTGVSVTINNCTVGETIYMDNNEDKMYSTNRIVLDKWNKKYLELAQGANNITLTGDFEMTMKYRIPVYIGG